MAGDEYRLYALKYAENTGRLRSRHFIRRDFHDGPSPLAMYVWLAVGPSRKVLIDLGGTEADATRRGHDFLRHPIESLRLLGVGPEEIDDVIVTHLHWDHAGNLDPVRHATIHLQWREMKFAVGPSMRHAPMRSAFEAEHICDFVRQVHRGGLTYHKGPGLVAPGIEIHLVGGHSMGQQIVRVRTARGWVVVASDAAHLYETIEQQNPFPTLARMDEAYDAFEKIRELADSQDHIIPGHDPAVLERYPPASPELRGIAARLDLAPGAP